MPIVGIYCITNKLNNKKYIGQSVNCKKRLSEHKSYLRRNIHYNEHLQNAYNRDGESNFTFEIIRECNKDELNRFEIYYIKEFNSYKKGYNQTDGGSNKELGMNNPLFDKKLNNSSSKYLGVSFYKKQKFNPDLWRSTIYLNGNQILIGIYHSEIDAAEAYNKYIINNDIPDRKLNIF